MAVSTKENWHFFVGHNAWEQSLEVSFKKSPVTLDSVGRKESFTPKGMSLELALPPCSPYSQALGLVLSRICLVTTGNERLPQRCP